MDLRCNIESFIVNFLIEIKLLRLGSMSIDWLASDMPNTPENYCKLTMIYRFKYTRATNFTFIPSPPRTLKVQKSAYSPIQGSGNTGFIHSQVWSSSLPVVVATESTWHLFNEFSWFTDCDSKLEQLIISVSWLINMFGICFSWSLYSSSQINCLAFINMVVIIKPLRRRIPPRVRLAFSNFCKDECNTKRAVVTESIPECRLWSIIAPAQTERFRLSGGLQHRWSERNFVADGPIKSQTIYDLDIVSHM